VTADTDQRAGLRTPPAPAAAARRSGVFFAAMTVAYYAWAAEVLGSGWDVRLLTLPLIWVAAQLLDLLHRYV
jgi:hypothetical protein